MTFLAKILTLSLLISLSTVSNFTSSASSPLDSKPINYESYKYKINESLAGFNCSEVNSIGFSGDWSISTEQKNKGINSLIFTSGNSMKSCGYRQFNFVYKEKTYEGNYWSGQERFPDFGNFSSSVVIPPLKLYGSDAPSVGSWVSVVRYAPGLGFIWMESRVRAYNPKTLVFAIDPTVPLVEKNALVFNNKGAFIGLVSKFTLEPVQGLVLVQGAPLQCRLNKEDRSTETFITDCSDGVYAQTIWANSKVTDNSGIDVNKQVCVTGTSKLNSFREQCSDSGEWVFSICDVQSKWDLQTFRNKKWTKLKTTNGIKDLEGCPSDDAKYNYLKFEVNGSAVGKYRIKTYGNSKFATDYINLKVTLKDKN
jgi:hypothetical protein